MRWLLAMSVAAVLSLPATDPLNDRSASTLGANWTAVSGALSDWQVVSGVGANCGTCIGADFSAGAWSADSFTADHYSQAAISKGASGYQGVGVRLLASGGANGYFVTLESGSCKFYKWVAGTRTDITSSGACSVSWTNGHTLKLAVTGHDPAALTAYDNGVSIGTASDNDIDSGGAPGLIGYSDGSGGYLSWQGDNNSAPAGGIPKAIIGMAPIKCCTSARNR